MNTSNISVGYSEEVIRKKLIALRIWTWVGRIIIPVSISVGFVLFALNIGTEMDLDDFAVKVLLPAAIVVAAIIGLLVVAYKQVSKLKGFMGSVVILPVLKEIFEVSDYQAHGHLKRELIRSAGLINEWEDISGSDYIEGGYKGIDFCYSDLVLTHDETDTDSDGQKHTKRVTDFKGQWLVCDFGKALAATVRLIERKGGTKWNRVHDISKSDIETENMEFNKKYRIITGDGHTAFYLLTPHFMERLLAADEAADASTLFSFINGKVHIVLYSGRDTLELKGAALGNMENVRQKFRDDMKYMTEIMDELLKNDTLFKGE